MTRDDIERLIVTVIAICVFVYSMVEKHITAVALGVIMIQLNEWRFGDKGES